MLRHKLTKSILLVSGHGTVLGKSRGAGGIPAPLLWCTQTPRFERHHARGPATLIPGVPPKSTFDKALANLLAVHLPPFNRCSYSRWLEGRSALWQHCCLWPQRQRQSRGAYETMMNRTSCGAQANARASLGSVSPLNRGTAAGKEVAK